MLEEVNDFLALLGLHLHQNLFSVFLVQIPQQIGGRAWIHLFHNIGRPLGIERLDNRFLNFGRNFLQRFRRHFFVKRLKHCLALIRSQILHDVCDIRRMQSRQTIVRNFQLHAARRISFNQIHEIPRDRSLWDLPQQ